MNLPILFLMFGFFCRETLAASKFQNLCKVKIEALDNGALKTECSKWMNTDFQNPALAESGRYDREEGCKCLIKLPESDKSCYRESELKGWCLTEECAVELETLTGDLKTNCEPAIAFLTLPLTAEREPKSVESFCSDCLNKLPGDAKKFCFIPLGELVASPFMPETCDPEMILFTGTIELNFKTLEDEFLKDALPKENDSSEFCSKTIDGPLTETEITSVVESLIPDLKGKIETTYYLPDTVCHTCFKDRVYKDKDKGDVSGNYTNSKEAFELIQDDLRPECASKIWCAEYACQIAVNAYKDKPEKKTHNISVAMMILGKNDKGQKVKLVGEARKQVLDKISGDKLNEPVKEAFLNFLCKAGNFTLKADITSNKSNNVCEDYPKTSNRRRLTAKPTDVVTPHLDVSLAKTPTPSGSAKVSTLLAISSAAILLIN